MIPGLSSDGFAKGEGGRREGMGCAQAGGVNAITFGTKRAFHGFLKVTRKPLAVMGLTAARFDMMSVLRGRKDMPWRWMRQSDLRRMLGVTASVVTRMVKALEALGLVRREREWAGDRRQIRLSLTDVGERCITEARNAMMQPIKWAVFIAVCFGRHDDGGERFRHMETLEGYLRSLRAHFGDTARLYYPWGHPDD